MYYKTYAYDNKSYVLQRKMYIYIISYKVTITYLFI